MKHVLITGVSTGIGYAAAQAFVLKGYHVYGSVRRQVDADQLDRTLGPQFSPLLFDVTDHAAIADAAKKVQAEIGREGLACLINNAGMATSGPLMLQPLDDVRRQFEVNVIGLLAVTQAFLLLLVLERMRVIHRGESSTSALSVGRLRRHLSELMSVANMPWRGCHIHYGGSCNSMASM